MFRRKETIVRKLRHNSTIVACDNRQEKKLDHTYVCDFIGAKNDSGSVFYFFLFNFTSSFCLFTRKLSVKVNRPTFHMQIKLQWTRVRKDRETHMFLFQWQRQILFPFNRLLHYFWTLINDWYNKRCKRNNECYISWQFQGLCCGFFGNTGNR